MNFTGTSTDPNNLGGMGPEFSAEREIRFIRIDGNTPDTGDYDLVVTNTSYYMPNMKNAAPGVAGNGANQNGVLGAFGNVNLMQGLDANIEMCFYKTGTDELATLERFFFTFYDFDLGVGATDDTEPKTERLVNAQHSNFFINTAGTLNEDPNDLGTLCIVREYPFFQGESLTQYPIYAPPDRFEFDGAPTGTDWTFESQLGSCYTYEETTGGGTGDAFYTNYPCTEIAVEKRSDTEYAFEGTVRGWGCDNPRDPKDLSDVMKARLVMFEYQDVSCLELRYEVDGNLIETSGRNFLFAGASFECDCQIQEFCAPPSAPP